jgi:predicted MPP superfamily phosphohydrolase
MLSQLEVELKGVQPQALLLGGDLIDFPWGYSNLVAWVQRQSQRWPVLAVPGNHDRWAGLKRLKQRLPQVHWLDESPAVLDGGLRLCGHIRQGATPTTVLVGHEPHRVRDASKAGFPLMLAGHLHGCQWIVFQKSGLDYPGAWFFAYHGSRFQVGPTTLHVSRGASDTLPIRLRCPRDYLLLELE